jgi:hypothetical protein
MAQLSFQFQYQYEQSSEKVFVPIRLGFSLRLANCRCYE